MDLCKVVIRNMNVACWNTDLLMNVGDDVLIR